MDALENRKAAGIFLAQQLEKYRDENPIVLGMPRGGIVVAFEIAKALNAPLDVIVSRKIGAPDQPEFAIGAIAPNDIIIIDEDLLFQFGLDEDSLQPYIYREKQEMERRLHLYRGDKPFPDLKNRIVIIADDGLATGRTAIAAIRSVKKMSPKKIIIAIGACARASQKILEEEADEVICVLSPENFYAVGQWYRDFSQTEDKEVIALLKQSEKLNG